MPKYLLIILLLCLPGCDRTEPDTTRPGPEETPPLPDFSSYQNTSKKKQAFITYMLPLVEEANEQVLKERQLVERWYLADDELSAEEQEEIHHLLSKYRVTASDVDEQKELLLRRVNIIPPSLVLAQAANESGWGTSRFAQEGNNLFGQWCFREGCGIVPEARGGSSRHEVQRFETPLNSVESYILNLNSHPRYRELRDLRIHSLQEDGYVNGEDLVPGLLGYSERGYEYIDEIRHMIEYNKLGRYDQTEPAENRSEPQPTSGE